MSRPEDLPGFRWMPGATSQHGDMVLAADKRDGVWLWIEDNEHTHEGRHCAWPDYSRIDHTDAATAGCLLRLLGDEAWRVRPSQAWLAKGDGTIRHLTFRAFLSDKDTHDWPERVAVSGKKPGEVSLHDSLGAACIAVATALGRWPGGGV